MSQRSGTRRTILLLVLAVTSVTFLLRYSLSGSPISWSSDDDRTVLSSSSSFYSPYLAHPSEADALPLVGSIASFSLAPPSAPADYFNVSICAVPTHENQYLPEWITWHRLLGVQRFYLFDNDPSLELRRLLRPWLEEGSVVLYELDYDSSVNIGSVYQTHVLRLCERHVLTTSTWVSHHDVDEFLMVDAPGWSSSIPSPLPSPSSDLASAPQWTFPLHKLFAQLNHATCVPMLRLPFQNYGVRELAMGQYVTEELTVRDRVPPNWHTYGKIFLHSERKAGATAWLGPHSCKPLPDTVILDAQGKEYRFERGNYPYAGLPLPEEGLYLHHYIQRSLADCYSKCNVLADTPQDWRTKDGLAGCARNYVPTDEELSNRTALLAEQYGEQISSRPESWYELYMRDTSARDSWQGRMTRAILDEWRRKGDAQGAKKGKWWWEMGDEARDERLLALPGIVEINHVVNVS
ncbi:hypothetical protein JCM1841_002726 [Sporobolomyces salmonicolor]